MTETPNTQSTRQQALNAASGAASKRLKEQYPEDWNKFMAQEATARNQTWSPKPTKEQKAEAEFHRLLAENPHLADSLTQPAETVVMPDPPPLDPA